MAWDIPILIGQIVELDTRNGRYADQAQGDKGVVTKVYYVSHENIVTGTVTGSEFNIQVQWQNGHINSYDDTDVTPVIGEYIDFKKVGSRFYTTIRDQIRCEANVMSGDNPSVANYNTEIRKTTLTDMLSHANNIRSNPRISERLELVKIAIRDLVERGEIVHDRDTFFAKANLTQSEIVVHLQEPKHVSYDENAEASEVDVAEQDTVRPISVLDLLRASEEAMRATTQDRPFNPFGVRFDEDVPRPPEPGIVVGYGFPATNDNYDEPQEEPRGRVIRRSAEVPRTPPEYRQPDESYDEWLARVVSEGVQVTGEMIQHAQYYSTQFVDDREDDDD